MKNRYNNLKWKAYCYTCKSIQEFKFKKVEIIIGIIEDYKIEDYKLIPICKKCNNNLINLSLGFLEKIIQMNLHLKKAIQNDIYFEIIDEDYEKHNKKCQELEKEWKKKKEQQEIQDILDAKPIRHNCTNNCTNCSYFNTTLNLCKFNATFLNRIFSNSNNDCPYYNEKE